MFVCVSSVSVCVCVFVRLLLTVFVWIQPVCCALLMDDDVCAFSSSVIRYFEWMLAVRWDLRHLTKQLKPRILGERFHQKKNKR